MPASYIRTCTLKSTNSQKKSKLEKINLFDPDTIIIKTQIQLEIILLSFFREHQLPKEIKTGKNNLFDPDTIII